MGDFGLIFGGLLNGLPFLISHFVTSVIVLLIGVITVSYTHLRAHET